MRIPLNLNNAQKNIKLSLIIKPLAALNLCHVAPGNYYMTSTAPSEGNIWGLLENYLGWHFGIDIRKELKKYAKTKKIILWETPGHFISIIAHQVDIKLKSKPTEYTRNSEVVILKKRRKDIGDYANITADRFQPEHHKQLAIIKSGTKEELNTLAKAGVMAIDSAKPAFYSTNVKKEYLDTKQEFVYELSTTEEIAELLLKESQSLNTYLGNSEGWVDVKISKI